MTDQTTLAALAVAVCDSLIANDGQWQYRLEAYRAAAVPPKYRAAGVRVTGDAGLDVERLARALARRTDRTDAWVLLPKEMQDLWRKDAAAIAREYAATEEKP